MDTKEIDWNHVFALDCSYTVDNFGSGRFCKEVAEKLAEQQKSVVRKDGQIISDFRSK